MFSNQAFVLDILAVSRNRSTVHNWVQKAELKREAGRDSGEIGLDETVVKPDGEQYWLVAAVEPETNVIRYVRLYPQEIGRDETVLAGAKEKTRHQ